MNQDKKTSSFLEAINKYAQMQSDAIKLEAEEFRKQEIEKATREGISDAYRLIQKEISLKKSLIISEVARREQESRNKLFIKRNEIMNSVFDDVKTKLFEFLKTDAYCDYIRKSVSQMAELFENKHCVIYVNEADLNKKDIINSELADCDIVVDNSIKLGGIKGYCQQMSVMADSTFDSKLNDEKVWFTQNCGLEVV